MTQTSVDSETLAEYSAMASDVYFYKPLPSETTYVKPAVTLVGNWAPLNSEAAPTYVDQQSATSSDPFTAQAFYNSNTNKVVIAFAGTDADQFTDKKSDVELAAGLFANPATLASILSNPVSALYTSAATDGLITLVDAFEYYVKVKTAYPNATISFTGHSLGGGIAALMSVFTGLAAVVFDDAPFAHSATSLFAHAIIGALQSLETPSNSTATNTAISGLRAFASDSTNPNNYSNIASYSLAGQFLDVDAPFKYLANVEPSTSRQFVSVGTVALESDGNTDSPSTQLHSMALLEAVDESTTFACGAAKLSVSASVLLSSANWLGSELTGIQSRDGSRSALVDLLSAYNSSANGVEVLNTGALNALGADFIAIAGSNFSVSAQICLGRLATEYQLLQGIDAVNYSSLFGANTSTALNLTLNSQLLNCAATLGTAGSGGLYQSIGGGNWRQVQALFATAAQNGTTITLQSLLPNNACYNTLIEEASANTTLGAATRYALANAGSGVDMIANNLFPATGGVAPAYTSEPASYWSARAGELLTQVALTDSSTGTGNPSYETSALDLPTSTSFHDSANGFNGSAYSNNNELPVTVDFLANNSQFISGWNTSVYAGTGDTVSAGVGASGVTLYSGGHDTLTGSSTNSTTLVGLDANSLSTGDTLIGGFGTTTIIAGTYNTIDGHIPSNGTLEAQTGTLNILAKNGDAIYATGAAGSISLTGASNLNGGSWNGSAYIGANGETYTLTPFASGTTNSNYNVQVTSADHNTQFTIYDVPVSSTSAYLGLTFHGGPALTPAEGGGIVGSGILPDGTLSLSGLTTSGGNFAITTDGLEVRPNGQTLVALNTSEGTLYALDSGSGITDLFVDPPATSWEEATSGNSVQVSEIAASVSPVANFTPETYIGTWTGFTEETNSDGSITTTSTYNGDSITLGADSNGLVSLNDGTELEVIDNEVSILNPDGTTQTVQLNSDGTVSFQASAAGAVIQNPILQADGSETTNDYSLNGTLQSSTTYSAANVEMGSSVVNADGSTSVTSSDDSGDSSTITTSTVGALLSKSTTFSDGSSVNIAYAANGSVITTDNFLPNENVCYKIITTDYADGTVETQSYGNNGTNTTQMVYTDGSSSTTNYDLVGKVSSVENTYADGSAQTLFYNDTGTLTETLNIAATGATVEIQNRDDGSVETTTKDPSGILLSDVIVDSTGTITYSNVQNIDGSYTSTQPNSDGGETVVTLDPSTGNFINYEYTEASGSAVQAFYTAGVETEAIYSNFAGETVLSYGSAGAESVTGYSNLGSLQYTESEVNGVVTSSSSYASDGSITAVSEDNGTTTTSNFDSYGNVIGSYSLSKNSDSSLSFASQTGNNAILAKGIVAGDVSEVATVVNPDNSMTTTLMDASGNVLGSQICEVSSAGNYCFQTYNALGLEVGSGLINSDGSSIVATPHSAGGLSTVNYSNGVEIGSTITIETSPDSYIFTSYDTAGMVQIAGVLPANSTLAFSQANADGAITTTFEQSDGTVIGTELSVAAIGGGFTYTQFDASGIETGQGSVRQDSSSRALIIISNDEGNSLVTSYDSSGNVISTSRLSVDSDGSTSFKSYDVSGTELAAGILPSQAASVTTVASGNGSSISTFENATGAISGYQSSQPVAGGGYLFTTYDSSHTEIGYGIVGSDGTLVSSQIKDGITDTSTYTPTGNLRSYEIDTTNTQTVTVYDSAGNITSENTGTFSTDSAGDSISTVINDTGSFISKTTVTPAGDKYVELHNSDGSHTITEYAVNGDLLQTEQVSYNSDLSSQSTTYNAQSVEIDSQTLNSSGQVLTDTQYLGGGAISLTVNSYEAGSLSSYVVTNSDGAGNSLATTYDATGAVQGSTSRSVDSDGEVTITTNDAYGYPLTSQATTSTSVTTNTYGEFAYSPSVNIIEVLTSDQATTTAGVTVTDDASYTYNSEGTQIGYTLSDNDGNGDTVSSSFDAQNNRVAYSDVTSDSSYTVSNIYGPGASGSSAEELISSNSTTISGPLTNISDTSYTYDSTDALTSTTVSTDDGRGYTSLVITDANSNILSAQYSSPQGSSDTINTYNSSGQILTTEVSNTQNGALISTTNTANTYSSTGSVSSSVVSSATYASGVVTYQETQTSRNGVLAEDDSTTYAYDSTGVLLSKTVSTNDEAGNTTSTTTDANNVVQYASTESSNGSWTSTSLNSDNSLDYYTNDGSGGSTDTITEANGVVSYLNVTNDNGTGSTTYRNPDNSISQVDTTTLDSSGDWILTERDGSGKTLAVYESFADGGTSATNINFDGTSTVTVTDSLGNITATTYAANGTTVLFVSSEPVGGQVTERQYNSDGSSVIINTSTANDGSSSVSTDPNGNILNTTDTYTDSSGNTITETKNAAGVVVESWTDGYSAVSDTYNLLSSFTINPDGSQTTVTDSYTADNSRTSTSSTVNLDGSVLTSNDTWTINADGSQTEVSQNSDGTVSTTTINYVEYDAFTFSITSTKLTTSNGTLISTTTTYVGPEGGSSSVVHYANGSSMTSIVGYNDELASRTTVNVDGSSVAEVYHPDGSVTATNTSAAGTITSVTITQASGAYTSTLNLSNGNIETVSGDGLGNSINTTTSSSGTVLSRGIITAAGLTETDTYNSNGTTTSSYSDTAGNVASVTFNAAGDALASTFSAGTGDTASNGILAQKTDVDASGNTAVRTWYTSGLFTQNLASSSGAQISKTTVWANGSVLVNTATSVSGSSHLSFNDGNGNTVNLVTDAAGQITSCATATNSADVAAGGVLAAKSVTDPSGTIYTFTWNSNGSFSLQTAVLHGSTTTQVHNSDGSGSTSYNSGAGISWSATTTSAGNETATALTGAAALITGSGNDALNANSAGDTLTATTGTDTLVGGAGADTFIAGSGTDVLGGGYTTAAGEADSGALNGVYHANGTNTGNTYIAGTGNSTFNGTVWSDLYEWNLGDGNVTINEPGVSTQPNAPARILQLGAGITQANLTVSRTGTNLVITVSNGSNPSKTITFNNWYVNSTNSRVASENQISQINFSNGTSMTASQLTTAGLIDTAGAGNVTLAGLTGFVNTLTTGSGNDTLTAGNLGDTLTATTGNDVLVGGAGADTLIAGSGTDILGGSGYAGTSNYSTTDAGDSQGTYTANGTNLGNTYIAGSGTATFYGTAWTDTYEWNLGDGNITIAEPNLSTQPTAPASTLKLGPGITQSAVSVSRNGTALVLTIANGTATPNTVTINNWYEASTNSAVAGEDRVSQVTFADGTSLPASTLTSEGLVQNAGNGGYVVLNGATDYVNTLVGGTGRDILYAANEGDTLSAGTGSDAFAGGVGADTYLFNLGFASTDTISSTGDTNGQDLVEFGASLAATTLSAIKSGTSLDILDSSGGEVSISSWFSGSNQMSFEMPNGTRITAAQINSALSGSNPAAFQLFAGH